MNRIVTLVLALACTAPALSAPPPALHAAIVQWAAPRTVERFQFSLVDLNADRIAEAVVHVTDPALCGNGGCPLLIFRGTATGFEHIANSGFVRKPIYILQETGNNWKTLAAVAGFGHAAGLVPIRFKSQIQGYRSTPVMNPHLELTAAMTERTLEFEEYENAP